MCRGARLGELGGELGPILVRVQRRQARLRSDGRAFAASLAHAAPDTTAALATAVVWCGAVTCAYTIWAQSFGQRGVTAARANLVYTSQPVFSALFAFGLLHEVPTAATLAGGGLILIAVAAEVLAMDEAPA